MRRLVTSAAVALCAGSAVGGSVASAQPTHTLPLLPLARGAVLVSLGDPPDWAPVAGRPLTVTLFSGPPAGRTRKLNAYIAFEPTVDACQRSPRHVPGLLTIRAYYAAADDVTGASLFTPGGGARAGDVEASIPGVVIHGTDSVRACIWLARSKRARSRPATQVIPLLNGLFAASVSEVATAGVSSADSYTLNAIAVGESFSYASRTLVCGRSIRSAAQPVGSDSPLSDSVSYLVADACATDGTQFTFTGSAGSLGSLLYTTVDATTSPAAVTVLGGCELDPVTGATLSAATRYVQADGCSVGRVLAAPVQPGVRRGAVLEAQIDGGIADAAPAGTAVDLVLNG